MATTPLYTQAELDANIAKLKSAELALMSGVAEYTLDMGGQRRQMRYRDLSEIRAHLAYFQAERVKLSTGHGPQSIVGRVYRG